VIFVSLSAGLLCLTQSPPPAALQRALAASDTATRLRAARELAEGGATWEKWLLRELGGGSPEEDRALVLACGLLGSEASFEALQRATDRGRKPEIERAFALLVYGALHPAAGADPKEDWKRGVTPYERACLLAGLLAQAHRFETDEWHALAIKDPDATASVLLEIADVLLGRSPPVRTADPLAMSGRLLTSILPQQPAVSWIASAEDLGLPRAWQMAARQHPPRSLVALRAVPLADENAAVVLALYEVPESQRAELFAHFRTRLQAPEARAWLWGAAGDLGLDLAPVSLQTLDPAEVAGLLRLALRDPTAAERAALSRLALARKDFAVADSPAARFPAALVLALAGGSEEHALLRQAIEVAAPRERLDLQPVWKYAQRGFGEAGLQREWIARWSRRLGAGAMGFLDREGARWTAYVLAGNTRAASQSPRMQPRIPALDCIPHDHALDVSLHADVIEFLIGGEYRWWQAN
jgi:hypothetical protein